MFINMNTNSIVSFLKARKVSNSELARRMGLSRQAISLWFKSSQPSLRSKHLLKLAELLEVPVEMLARPLPGYGPEHERLKAEFLWDRIYPDLDDFAIAVNHWSPQALARLVQVRGLYAAERIMGKKVWQRFDSYKRFIHPARRRQLEGLVQWKNNLTAN